MMVDYAYTAVMTAEGAIIGRTESDLQTYLPQPEFGKFVSFEAAQGKADALNAELQLSREEARRIVVTSVPDGGPIELVVGGW